MKHLTYIFLFLAFLINSTASFADEKDQPAETKFQVDLNLIEDVSICKDRELEKRGWEIVKIDEWYTECHFQWTYEKSELPFSENTGNYTIAISEEGIVFMDYNYGDMDGGADARMTIPTFNGKFLPADKPYSLEFGGGDYASGSWSAKGSVKITIIPAKKEK